MALFSRNSQLDQLLIAAGSQDEAVAQKALHQIAKAVEEPLRKGVMSGDIYSDIFETMDVAGQSLLEFDLDFLTPGTEGDFSAYVVPNTGMIPMRNVEGAHVTVPTFPVANSIDWPLHYARNARWDVVDRGVTVLRDGFVKKLNDDAWHVITAAGFDRNIIVQDAAAVQGFFSKRLVSVMKVVMRRNGGGNSTSVNRGALTDLYISAEAAEDMRNWNVDQVDEVTRREIFLADDEKIARVFQVNLHTLDELGQGQEYELYYENTLGGTLPANKIELVVGLDLRNKDSFVLPIRQELQVFEDVSLHRQMRQGFYAWMEYGVAVLSSQRVLLGAL